MPASVLPLLLLLLLPRSSPHFHEQWDEGFNYRYRWFEQEWVGRVRQFYCDESCAKRLSEAPTIDLEGFTQVVRLLREGGLEDGCVAIDGPS